MLRKLGFLATTGLVIMAALLTGAVEVYFFLYLGVVTIGLAYLLARRGLSDLEAGSWLDRHHATVGAPVFTAAPRAVVAAPSRGPSAIAAPLRGAGTPAFGAASVPAGPTARIAMSGRLPRSMERVRSAGRLIEGWISGLRNRSRPSSRTSWDPSMATEPRIPRSIRYR